MHLENDRRPVMSVPVQLRLLFALALLALGAACGDAPKPLARLPADAVVLAFGDSLTFGTGAQEAESYPAQLARLIGRRVVRAGIPGEVTSQALARLPEELDEHAPRLLLLCIGGNDFLQRLPVHEAERNVRAMVRLARDRGVDVVLIGTPEPGLQAAPPVFYGAIAKEFGLVYEGAILGEVLKSRGLKSDLVHPNAKGYRVIAERLAETLKESGAI
ncbi:MAG TPA: GDSL-type esterase/lipase family protein [Burkholderiales bacterium]|nr:GDSL-type esterase/lipase family protein [Burkholderiales bacterium]